jgi:telomere length regulation protein
MMLLSIMSVPFPSKDVQRLSLSPAFIESIGTYINHLDPAVRRCGLLVAEVVAGATGKKLCFNQWEGSGQGQEWARSVRKLILTKDCEAEEAESDVVKLEIADTPPAVSSATLAHSERKTTKRIQTKVLETNYDSDDSLEGYASEGSDTSSLSPSELDEIEKDPTTNVGKKKISRPVYLIDLATLITSSAKPDDPQNADRIEMALDCGEDLIRRKHGFGFELGES